MAKVGSVSIVPKLIDDELINPNMACDVFVSALARDRFVSFLELIVFT